jgi:hypothetical protein
MDPRLLAGGLGHGVDAARYGRRSVGTIPWEALSQGESVFLKRRIYDLKGLRAHSVQCRQFQARDTGEPTQRRVASGFQSTRSGRPDLGQVIKRRGHPATIDRLADISKGVVPIWAVCRQRTR